MAPDKVCTIIVASAVLHNMAICEIEGEKLRTSSTWQLIEEQQEY